MKLHEQPDVYTEDVYTEDVYTEIDKNVPREKPRGEETLSDLEYQLQEVHSELASAHSLVATKYKQLGIYGQIIRKENETQKQAIAIVQAELIERKMDLEKIEQEKSRIEHAIEIKKGLRENIYTMPKAA